jgi:myo-inositol-1(or 4)-monophosphatase
MPQKEYIEAAKKAALEAGDVLKRSFRGLEDGDVEFKGVRNPVTRLDRESEEIIVGILKSAFPSHAVLAEEGLKDAAAEFRWIIDPLDGTINYLSGIPVYAVSIGLEIRGAPEVGVVHAPSMGETFWAERGKGAFMNGEPVRVSRASKLMDSVLATGFPYDRTKTNYNNLDNFSRLILKSRGMRRLGAAAVDLCYVAAGFLDGFWEAGLQPWDTAAGAVILREAGGRITDFSGGDNWLFGKNVVASNGLIHESILENITPYPGDGAK